MRKSADRRKTFISVNTNLRYINMNQRWNDEKGEPHIECSLCPIPWFSMNFDQVRHILLPNILHSKEEIHWSEERPLLPKATTLIRPLLPKATTLIRPLLPKATTLIRPLLPKAPPTQGHHSYQARFQMHWDNKILLNCPSWKRGHPSYRVTVS